jgi:hypothetical protein
MHSHAVAQIKVSAQVLGETLIIKVQKLPRVAVPDNHYRTTVKLFPAIQSASTFNGLGASFKLVVNQLFAVARINFG